MDETTPAPTETPMNKQSFSLNKTYVYGAVVVVVLALVGGAYVLMGKAKAPEVTTTTNPPAVTVPVTTQESSPTGVAATSVEVDYTDAGFTPTTVTIKKGSTVKFVNKSAGKMSIASNPHPTHTIYPEFDQYKSDQKGQNEYSFTFEKVGTWGYHNHMQASDGGTVVVTE